MKVLAVSSTEKSLAMLRSLISDAGALPSLASSATAAKRRILDEDWDAIIINHPLMDEPGIELAHMAATETDAAVIMLMRSDASSLYAKRLSEDGMMVVEKPIMREALCSALSLVPYLQAMKAANRKRIREMEKRIEELRIVGKAKCELARRGGMDEDTAHKLIEHRAMDMRVTLKDAALSILREME